MLWKSFFKPIRLKQTEQVGRYNQEGKKEPYSANTHTSFFMSGTGFSCSCGGFCCSHAQLDAPSTSGTDRIGVEEEEEERRICLDGGSDEDG